MKRHIQILLIEDNPADAGLVEEAFQDGHLLHDIHVAPDGEVALQLLAPRRQIQGRAESRFDTP